MSTTPLSHETGAYPAATQPTDAPSPTRPATPGKAAPGRAAAAAGSVLFAVGAGLSATGRSLQRTPLAWTQVGGGLLAALGSLLPWITYTLGDESVSRNGFDYGADGVVVLVLSLVLVALGVASALGLRLGGLSSALPLVLAAALALVGILAWIEVLASGPEELEIGVRLASGLGISSGVGIWFVVVGAVVALAAVAVPAVLPRLRGSHA